MDTSDPLALFAHDQQVKATQAVGATAAAPDLSGPDGSVGLAAPIQGTVVAVLIAEGDEVRTGQDLVVLEAMKMEHVIHADRDGLIRSVACAVGDVMREGLPAGLHQGSAGQRRGAGGRRGVRPGLHPRGICRS